MKFGREVMQMLLGGKKVASNGYVGKEHIAMDADGVVKFYYDDGDWKSITWLPNNWRELPTDSTDTAQCTCHGCKLGGNCVKAFEAGTGKGWREDSKEQADKAIPDIEYTTVLNSTVHLLEKNVNELISQGWRPSGGVCYGGEANKYFVQAMTREV